MEASRLLIILTGILLGILAREYLEGWYSVIFESILWTVIIALIINKFRKHKNGGNNNDKLKNQ